MGCTQLDINNISHDTRVDLKNYDVGIMVEEFELKRSANPDFFYSIVKDSVGRLKLHVFWVDSMIIEDYKLFGNVDTFDKTYKTNVYSFIFGIFCGVNHYRKIIIFGNAFLR